MKGFRQDNKIYRILNFPVRFHETGEEPGRPLAIFPA
jgi:hypothetical protein